MSDEPVVDVPAPLEVEERLVGRLTVRQSAYAALGAVGGLLLVIGPPSPVRLAAGALLVALAVPGALVRPGGRPLDGWLGPLMGYWRRPRADSAPSAPAPRAPAPSAPAPSAPARHRGGPRRPAPVPALLAVGALVAAVAWPVGTLLDRPAPPASPPVDPTEVEIDQVLTSLLDALAGTPTPAPAPAPAPALSPAPHG
ncbi:MAG: hypothetical protein ACYDAQ_03655 [Mycobacteriales bacterium]